MPHLRVLAGTSPDTMVPISSLVNSNKPHRITSELFDGEVVANIKGFTDNQDKVIDNEYFDREDRQGITWSIQVQGRFLKNYSADDILFGNTFDRPLNLPWGSGAALKFMNYIDPTLEHDLTSSTKPWALSPLISTMPHFVHTRLRASKASQSSSLESIDSSVSSHGTSSAADPSQPPNFPPVQSLADDTSHLHLALVPESSPSSSSSSLSSTSSSSSSKSSSSRSSLSASVKSALSSKKSREKLSKRSKRSSPDGLNLNTASQRRSFFSSPENRQKVIFGPKDVITTDFCYGFLEFSPTLSLRLPGGISFDLMRYWDGQPVRFVCCERKDPDDDSADPWGKILWCVVVELCND